MPRSRWGRLGSDNRGGDGPSAEGIEDDKRARGSSSARDWKKEIGKVSAVFHSAHSKRRYVFPKPFEIAALAAAEPVFIGFFRQRLAFVRQSKLCPAHERLKKHGKTLRRRRGHGGLVIAARHAPPPENASESSAGRVCLYKALLNQ